MMVSKDGSTLTADIHGMTVADAKKALERLRSSADKNVTEIVVIHGYLGGKALSDMVRKKLSHPRIARKILSMNQGECDPIQVCSTPMVLTVTLKQVS
jgi:hypothetical protein